MTHLTRNAGVNRAGGFADATAAPDIVSHESWCDLKDAATALSLVQVKDGSIPDATDHAQAKTNIERIVAAIGELSPYFPSDSDYLDAVKHDLQQWVDADFSVPDFSTALAAFQPQLHRVDGLRHLVVFPMYTQNGSPDHYIEAILIEVIWPNFVAEIEAHEYSNSLFVPIRFLDFTSGYDTFSAVLFPETVAVATPADYTWGAIFADREAARFRRVVAAASKITQLDLPAEAKRLLDDQALTEHTYVMWDLIHDRTHMRGDLPFDPFMIKQRMPYFLYSLEELRCDLTAFREAVRISNDSESPPVTRKHASLAKYTIIFDRIFRFAITGTRVRNYDGLGGQLLFAWMHQHHVLHWTDGRLTIDWAEVPAVVSALGDAIDDLYWRSIDRPKAAHWLAAYDLVAATLTPNPASAWARGLSDEVLSGPPGHMTSTVLDDEFPLSMFYEALAKKMRGVIESTTGITGATAA